MSDAAGFAMFETYGEHERRFQRARDIEAAERAVVSAAEAWRADLERYSATAVDNGCECHGCALKRAVDALLRLRETP